MEEKHIILTALQQKAYDTMVEGKNLFLTGQGGTGKSLVIRKFREEWRGRKNIAVTSTTGVSALLIRGITLHSYLGIGLGTSSVMSLYDKISKTKTLQNWRMTDVLIIDEVSMLHPDLFDKIEHLGRLLRQNNKPFGGIQLVLSGDWLQLPVVGSDKMCFEASCWNRCGFVTVVLTENVRQGDERFQRCLSEMRMGKLTGDNLDLIKSLMDVKLEEKNGVKPTIILTTNADVDVINKREIDKLAGEEGDINARKFYSYDMEIEVASRGRRNIKGMMERISEKYKKNCNAPTELMLCKDAQVMLLYNCSVEEGLVNGSRGVVTDFIEGIPVVRFLNGVEMTVGWKTWDYEEDDDLIISISQIPLRLGYAVTVHKCQGATLDYAVVNLRHVFEYAQVYTALSRVKSVEGLSITGLDLKGIRAHPKALRFYREQEEEFDVV